MTAMQWRIWGLAAAGKFFEGLVVFMTGVATPLIAREFNMTATEHGLVSAATLFGILIGAIALGGLADYFGRKLLFIGEMIIFVVFLVLLTASPSLPWLIVFLFGIGLALGCDYPTAHLMISESTPSNLRGRLVLSAFGFQALGVLAGTAVGYEVLHNIPDIGAWRWMYATAIVPALAGDHRALLRAGERVMAAVPRPDRGGRADHGGAAATPAALSPQRQAAIPAPGTIRPTGPHFAPLCGSLQPAQSAGDDSGLGALVSAGSGDLWHRHLHADHPGRRPSAMSPSMPAISPISSTTTCWRPRGLRSSICCC